MGHHQLDSLDEQILRLIASNARIPFLEVARACNVSGAAIHQRIQKLTNLGILKGSEYVIDPEKIGYETCAYIGLYLKDPEQFDSVTEALKNIPEVVECHFTTGQYDMFINFLQEVEKGHYKLNDHGLIMTGVFQRKSNGKNSFIPDDGGETIFIAERNSAHAMNNDKVKIALFAKRKNRNPEGEVIEILERANDTFVGTLKVEKFYAFLLTENRTLANDIFIPKDKLKGGKNGDKAVVKIVEWPEEAKNPIGQVIDILGKAGENTTEMHAILAEFGLPYVYPKNVETAAEKIPAEISETDYAEREDFRNVTTFTIDPKDAKDFDDESNLL